MTIAPTVESILLRQRTNVVKVYYVRFCIRKPRPEGKSYYGKYYYRYRYLRSRSFDLQNNRVQNIATPGPEGAMTFPDYAIAAEVARQCNILDGGKWHVHSKGA